MSKILGLHCSGYCTKHALRDSPCPEELAVQIDKIIVEAGCELFNTIFVGKC